MRRKSYIGITDFNNSAEAYEMLNMFRDTDRVLMIGIMMSHKTLNGVETKWKDSWPKNEEIKHIFVNHLKAFNTLHYADFEGIDILKSLEKAAEFGGPDMHALQLDMVWPNEAEIKAFRENHPDLPIILQIGEKAFDMVENSPVKLIKKLSGYGDSLDYVLLDKSMGKGVEMEPHSLMYFLRALTIHRSDLGLAVAGGLGPKTLHIMEPIVEEFPNISIDAQGRLRPSGNALDPIDWNMAREYVEKAIKMFK